jgi:hypothetical protein
MPKKSKAAEGQQDIAENTETPEEAGEVAVSEELTAKVSELETQRKALEDQIAAARGQAEKAVGSIKNSLRAAELSDALHPDIVNLAPQIELDENLQPTAASLEGLRAWKAERKALFAQPVPQAQPAPQAPPQAPHNPGLTTPAPTSKGQDELTEAEIQRVMLKDRDLYLSPAFQAKVLAFYQRGGTK